MNPSPKTLRLMNVDNARRQISLSLNRTADKTSQRLRRGTALTPILIPVGGYYDVCEKLGVSFEEAIEIVDSSPEVRMNLTKKTIEKRVFPPDLPQAARDALQSMAARDAEKKTAALNPPDPPNAVPVGIDLELAAPYLLERGIDPTLVVRATRPKNVVMDPPISLETDPLVELDVPVEVDERDVSHEPSMAWTAADLRKKAAELKLETGGGKVALLKRIRKAMEGQ